MGNRLVIPNADFSSIGTKSIRTQKIELNDNDFVYGWAALKSANDFKNFNLQFESEEIKTINHGLNGYSKITSTEAYGVEQIAAYATKNYRTYMIDIPDGAIAIGGLFQHLVNKGSNSSVANALGGFYADDTTCIQVTNSYWDCMSKDNMNINANDTFETVKNKINESFKDYSNAWSKTWPYLKVLDVYDYPVASYTDETGSQKWMSIITDSVFMIPSGAKYFFKTIFFPNSYTFVWSNPTRYVNPLINTGFTESHLYWIFE